MIGSKKNMLTDEDMSGVIGGRKPDAVKSKKSYAGRNTVAKNTVAKNTGTNTSVKANAGTHQYMTITCPDCQTPFDADVMLSEAVCPECGRHIPLAG